MPILPSFLKTLVFYELLPVPRTNVFSISLVTLSAHQNLNKNFCYGETVFYETFTQKRKV